jgi:PII-like signaling protein
MKQQEMVLMRIFVGESDRFGKQPLYEALVELFHKEGVAGATVIKGAMGYGGNSEVHSDRFLRLSSDLPAMGYGGNSEVHSDRFLRLSSDLPVVVEVVDVEEKINAVLPLIEGMFQGGLITLEKARVIKFNKDI